MWVPNKHVESKGLVSITWIGKFPNHQYLQQSVSSNMDTDMKVSWHVESTDPANVTTIWTFQIVLSESFSQDKQYSPNRNISTHREIVPETRFTRQLLLQWRNDSNQFSIPSNLTIPSCGKSFDVILKSVPRYVQALMCLLLKPFSSFVHTYFCCKIQGSKIHILHKKCWK